ncbi:MAG: hypothetical protein A2Z25_08060 [Planctomycetes bacterium RBG_16_55_9]|nr:MAG: hypothetical protein A2Z25_08060 [Planctomycetes bacterium RBG_16_55_9]
MNDTILFVVKFTIRGSLRFLSHAEMLRVFQRACVRAGIRVSHSEGFNPRPKLSLPLPRPVGVEADDELLCLRVLDAGETPSPQADESQMKGELAAQLPEGCELLSVSIVTDGASFQSCSATYVLPVRRESLDERLEARVEQLLARETLNVRRSRYTSGDDKSLRIKNVDVRGFLKSIKLDNRGIIVECKSSPDGSIRVDEILELLGLDESKLSGPVRRTNVQWKNY